MSNTVATSIVICYKPMHTSAAQAQLHPKSVWEVPGSWRSTAQPWDGYGDGRGVLAGTEARDELLDRIRFFAEECDAMQARTWPQLSKR